MEVMKPDLYIAQGFRFRVNPGSWQSPHGRQFADPASSFSGPGVPYVEEEDFNDDGPICRGYDAEDVASCDVEVTEPYSGKFEARVPVPSVLFGSIIGKGGNTRKRIEKETLCSLRIPKMGSEGDVVITSAEKSNVLAAARRLFVIAETQRHKLKFTHFISLPLNSEPLISKVKEFRQLVDECCGQGAIDARLFNDPRKMHMTLQMMTLLDDRERGDAQALLNRCFQEKIKPKIKDMKSFPAHLKGLEIMNDDLSATQVLYAKVMPVLDSSGSRDVLQEIADEVAEFFKSSGLTPDLRGDKVKLHVTLMNSKNLSSDSATANDGGDDDGCEDEVFSSAWKMRRRTDFPKFDARTIFANLHDFDFGTTLVTEIHLSQLHTVSDDGYYRASLVIPLFSR